jgi:hypothetical protein
MNERRRVYLSLAPDRGIKRDGFALLPIFLLPSYPSKKKKKLCSSDTASQAIS